MPKGLLKDTLVLSTLLATALAFAEDHSSNAQNTTQDTAKAHQQEPQFVIAGPVLLPEYQGSDDYEVVPMAIAKFRLGSLPIELEGLTLRADLYQRARWRFGLTSELDTGRGDDVSNAEVARMQEIDFAANVGGFVAYSQPGLFLPNDNMEYRLSLLGDSSNTHGGYYGTAALNYAFPLMLPWRVELELESSYASSDYMNTYFGVDATDASRSGLARYNAGASLRDVTLNTNILLFTSPKWGGFVRLGVSQLLGDAKDSPITQQGSDLQYHAGIGVFYRFGE